MLMGSNSTKTFLRTGVLATFAWGSLLFTAAAQQKDAEPATRAANERFKSSLPPVSDSDFEDARRGLVAVIPDGIIAGPNQRPAWNMKAYDFEQQEEPPATVNPSLWRQARLNAIHGLFKVTDRVYQTRYDLSYMTIVEGDTGLILIDPMLTAETSKAALDLYYRNRPRTPVLAVIYTHSHADHYGGVKGVVNEQDVTAGKIKIFAPDHFMDFAVSENVIAGNAMSRRAWYMYGAVLPPGPRGQVDAGLGKALSAGSFTLIPPTDLITEDTQKLTVDGVDIEFLLTPGTEAPAEMVMYFPQFRLFDAAEIATHNMHNIYTLRGAEVRDARIWSHYLAVVRERWADKSDVMIAQHHWPTWGSNKISSLLAKQRDLYKYIHDQTVRLFNEGYTPTEISEVLKLPPSLSEEWMLRGYYGSLSHNSKGVYQRYLGWYDANPAHLSPLPPVQEATKRVEYMGGPAAAVRRARDDFAAGNYRWVASVMNDVVFAEPTNKEARELAADALEQLGYQAENATWRNAYLTGALELRSGIPKVPVTSTLSPDAMKGISLDLLFDFLGVRLNAPKAEGKKMMLNWNFTDVGEKIVLNLENSTLTHTNGRLSEKADAGFVLTRSTLDQILLKQKSFPDAIKAGEVQVEGDPRKLGELISMLDEFTPGFPIIEPKSSSQ
jgi:alkyl sulfatase BDS1-like metallo-beta-lactamase superfamily hydrolase